MAEKTAEKQSVKEFVNNHGIVIGFVIIFLYLSIFAPNFLSASNMINILKQISCIGIATIGVGVLIIMNCIDLSIGSMFALSGVTAGIMVSSSVAGYGLPAFVGYAVGIATGVLFGAFNGIIVAKGKIPAFIVTMGTQSIARGLALILAHGMPIGSFSDSFNYLGSTSIGGVLPWSVIVFVIVVIVMNFVMKKRPIGRYVYAVGGNEDAARVAGINVDKIKIQAYLIEGALLGLASTRHRQGIRYGFGRSDYRCDQQRYGFAGR